MAVDRVDKESGPGIPGLDNVKEIMLASVLYILLSCSQKNLGKSVSVVGTRKILNHNLMSPQKRIKTTYLNESHNP